MTFARFMELALTHPREGYYSRVDRALGPRGDFSTAPSLSPAFNESVARLLAELVDASLTTAADAELPLGIVELGGGEGHLARAVLGSWNEIRQDLRARIAYSIVEVGAGLRRRQEEAVVDLRDAGWEVRWGPDVAQACAGVAPAVIVGNEFVDALPVHVIDVSMAAPREAWVVADEDVALTWRDLSPQAAGELELLCGTLNSTALRAATQDGIIEVRPGVSRLFDEVSRVMSSGCLVTIDYGDWFHEAPRLQGAFQPREELLKPGGSRHRTVRGYFRHQLSGDPLERVGQQDITADVDFGALDLHGQSAGFETVIFTSLAAFLFAGGGGQEPVTPRELPCCILSDPLETDRQSTILDALLDEGGLGGAFKVMVQVRG
jgi:SAM-dependent MidA family methyltransferase